MLVDYFYKDSISISQDTVCALLALSRQLLVLPVCQYCSDFVAQHLTTSNCIDYLRQAEKYQLHDIQQQAVALAAQGGCFVVGCRTGGGGMGGGGRGGMGGGCTGSTSCMTFSSRQWHSRLKVCDIQ
jgi:hypothetical protein